MGNVIDARFRFIDDYRLVFSYNNALAQWEVEQAKAYPREYLLKNFEDMLEATMKEIVRRDLHVRIIEGGRVQYPVDPSYTYDWFN